MFIPIPPFMRLAWIAENPVPRFIAKQFPHIRDVCIFIGFTPPFYSFITAIARFAPPFPTLLPPLST
jgi:hypothetical protein